MRTRLAQRGSIKASRGKPTVTIYVPVKIKAKPGADIREIRDDINDMCTRISCATHSVEVCPRVSLRFLRAALAPQPIKGPR